MIIHPKIVETQTQEFQDALLKIAKLKKLNKINFKKRYDVIKVFCKKNKLKESNHTILRAIPYLIGNEKAAAMYFYTINEWFHCSEIVKCTKFKKHIRIETLNSVYKLIAWE